MPDLSKYEQLCHIVDESGLALLHLGTFLDVTGTPPGYTRDEWNAKIEALLADTAHKKLV